MFDMVKKFNMIKLIFCFLIPLSLSTSSLASTTVYAVDQRVSCAIGSGVGFPCGSPAVEVGLADNFLGKSAEERSAIEFYLGGIEEVANADLRMLATGFSAYLEVFNNFPVIEIHGYIGNGVVEYNDLFTNNLITKTESLNTLGVYTFDVTDYVNTLVRGGASFVGFAFRNLIPNSAISFYTPDGKSNALIISPEFTAVIPPNTAVPLPGTFFLFSTVCLGLTFLRI